MHVVLGTAHDAGYRELANITFPSVKAYAEKWGYGLAYNPNVNEKDKDACKIDLYKQVYQSGNFCEGDVFVWIDTDALVMNSHRRIEAIVHEHMPRTIHYLIGVDPNGLNSGVFIARFSPEAFSFMDVSTIRSGAMGWADQEGLIQTAIRQPFKDIYKEIPGKVFNCNDYAQTGWEFLGEYGNYVNRYEPGDFILHLAGIEEPRRSELLKLYAKHAR